MRWVDRFQAEEEIKRHNRNPIAYKIHKDQVKFILAELKKNKTITMDEIKIEKIPNVDENSLLLARNEDEIKLPEKKLLIEDPQTPQKDTLKNISKDYNPKLPLTNKPQSLPTSFLDISRGRKNRKSFV
mgnify:CR=1 FL=1